MQDRFFIAAAVREIGRLLRFTDENPFKSRAYERGAQALEELEADLDLLVRERRITEIQGVGAALAATIEELYRTGQSQMLERLRHELPRGILELADVPGLGLRKIAALNTALGVENLSDLKSACERGLLRKVKGFGPKIEAKIGRAIEGIEKREGSALLHKALEEGERLLRYLRAAPEIIEVDIAGALRRRKETVRRIGLVAASEKPEAVIRHFLRFPPIVQVTARNGDLGEVRVASGLHAKLQVVRPSNYVAALHYFTGSRKHYAKLEAIARLKGITIGLDGLRTDSGETLSAKEESEIYRHLGMPYIPPELREDEGEIEAASSGTLPRLVEIDDIQGIVHCHTLYSDGRAGVQEMARAAEAMGIKYLTITDHSPSAFFARGVKIDKLKAQWEEIGRVQEKVKVKLLKGTESDILDNGALDYPDVILEQFDIIIASIHMRAGMDAHQMTQRLLRMIKLPVFKIWGHPLGRLIQSRPPLECHMEEVLDAVAASKTALEVNGDPRRLDLEPRWIRSARRRGIKFVISTDAHSIEGLRNLCYGVAMARRGWLTRDEVLNTMDTEEFARVVHP
jgi:DNA polymerase (family 10)